MADDEYGTLSIWAPAELADECDEIAERWDEHTDLKTKRSVPARKALQMGLQILQMVEDEYGARRVADMPDRQLRAMARQGMVEYFKNERERDDDSDRV